MPAVTVGVLLCLVVAAGTVGGGATRYERHGPPAHRGPASALAIVCLTLAVFMALILFGAALLQFSGTAWRLLGVACAGGGFGALAAARYVDHVLAGGSWRRAVGALLRDVPWRRIAAAVSGVVSDARRRWQGSRAPR